MHSLSIISASYGSGQSEEQFDTAKATKARLLASDIGKTGWVVLVEE